VTLTSKLIDGTFPDYDRVIPRDNDKLLRIAKKDFAEAVDRVAAISSERSRPVKMAIAKQGLTLSAASPEQGTASEEIDADRLEYDAGPMEIGFQARYLRDITDQMADSVRVEFKFHDGAAPTLIRAEGDPRAVYVLMPMRV
jgi:DNA polymerase-3 subunit beta